MKTILEIVGPHWRLQAILVEGGLVKTILEIVAEPCQLLASPRHHLDGRGGRDAGRGGRGGRDAGHGGRGGRDAGRGGRAVAVVLVVVVVVMLVDVVVVVLVDVVLVVLVQKVVVVCCVSLVAVVLRD